MFAAFYGVINVGSFWFEKFLFTKLFFAELNMEQKRKKKLTIHRQSFESQYELIE